MWGRTAGDTGDEGVHRTRSSRLVLQHVGRALIRTAIMTWLVASITFVVVHALPGNPVDVYVQELMGTGLSGQDARDRASQLLRIDLGEPLIQQYGAFLSNLLHGDLGASTSLAPGTPVTEMILSRLPWTLITVGTALLIAFWIGSRLGTAAAYRRGKWSDHLITNTSAVLDSFPQVLVGIVFIFYVGVVWQLVPLDDLRGAYSPNTTPGFNTAFIGSAIQHAIAPILVYVVTSTGFWILAMRSSAVSTLREEYVGYAHARGLGERRVRSVYVRRNARLPLITGFAISLGFVVSGSVLVEYIFVYPGVGQLLGEALARRDYTVMQGVVIVTTFFVLIATAIADALAGWLDPRTRIQGQLT